MSPTDFLLTVAEIAIAFVGFSAIVIVFRRFASGAESGFQNLQVTAIIQVGLLALLLSLLPLLLGLFPFANAAAWRLSSVLFALSSALYVASYARRRARFNPPPGASQTGYYLRMGSLALVAAVQLLNAFLVPESLVAGIYCVGVIWLLVLLGWIFLGTWRLWGERNA